MGQYFVDVVQASQFLRDIVKAFEPSWVAALQKEFLLLESYQVIAVVTSCRLKNDWLLQESVLGKIAMGARRS